MTGTDPRRRRPRFPRRPARARRDPDTPAGPGPVLDRLAAIGPHFVLHHGPDAPLLPSPPPATTPGPGTEAATPGTAAFHPLADPRADPRGALLAGAAADTGRRIGTPDPRVGASTLHLGLSARLWSVALGCAVLAGRVPDLDPHRLRWRLPPGGSLELWLP
ncbi:hypothetical protein FOE67_25510, partial [Streptomyces calidiresistens]|nr:hypothetical protein [Streptomyces calidiresistens]